MKEIPSQRKTLYYVGMAMTGIGAILFVSVFVSGALHFGDFSRFEERIRGQFLMAIAGMVLIAVGVAVRSIGARGVAGSGVVLDPRKAREDLEPWARMGGGLLKDAVEEAGVARPALAFDEKLRRLEALRKDGLISEAEHAAKRAQILDEKL